MSSGPNWREQWPADHVCGILRWAKPAELLVEQPTELDPIVNLMAVKAGLSISPVPTR
jgi:hypothetical protein